MIYTSEGWLNVEHIVSQGLKLNIIIGGRGTGKTYGFLRYTVENNIIAILMRRTQTQLDMIANEDFSPYNAINEDLNLENPYIYFRENKNSYNLYGATLSEREKYTPCTECKGYGIALSTIKNLRGFNADKVEWVIFDEFIPEPHEKEIKQEGFAFQNAYETINRTRELKGKQAVRAFLLANANNLSSDIILTYNLVPILDKMMEKGLEEWIDKKRSVGVWLLRNSPISEAKKSTGLYGVASEDFVEMSLNNNFAQTFENVGPQPIKEYKPICTIGGLVFYRHKSNGSYYITTHKSGTPKEYMLNKIGIKTWKIDNRNIITAFIRHRCFFETKYCYIVFTKSLL